MLLEMAASRKDNQGAKPVRLYRPITESKQIVINLLQANSLPVHIKNIETHLQRGNDTVSKILHLLKKEKLVEKAKRAHWKLKEHQQ